MPTTTMRVSCMSTTTEIYIYMSTTTIRSLCMPTTHKSLFVCQPLTKGLFTCAPLLKRLFASQSLVKDLSTFSFFHHCFHYFLPSPYSRRFNSFDLRDTNCEENQLWGKQNNKMNLTHEDHVQTTRKLTIFWKGIPLKIPIISVP